MCWYWIYLLLLRLPIFGISCRSIWEATLVPITTIRQMASVVFWVRCVFKFVFDSHWKQAASSTIFFGRRHHSNQWSAWSTRSGSINFNGGKLFYWISFRSHKHEYCERSRRPIEVTAPEQLTGHAFAHKKRNRLNFEEEFGVVQP